MTVEDSANPDANPDAGSDAGSDEDVHLVDVLILDYVAETRRAACEALADAGLNVSSAESLEAGLEALGRKQPDAVVISIDAPGLDGHALCEVIHRTYPARSFELFVITSSPAEDGLEWTATIPNLHVIAAPVTAQKLAGAIAAA